MAFKDKTKGRPTEDNVTMPEEAKAESEDADTEGEEAHGKGEKEEMKTGEELKRGGAHKRKRGGGLDGADEYRTSKIGDPKAHHPHHYARKKGGHVPPGSHSKGRPDRHKRGGEVSAESPFDGAEKVARRARGGATADLNPTTAAGNMSVPEYERQPSIPNGGGKGKDSKGKNG